MIKYVHIRHKSDCDLFEEILNEYIETDIFKQDIGTILREQDLDKFKEYFDKWVFECLKTQIVKKNLSSNKHKRHYWNENLSREEIKKEGLKALRTMGMV